MLGYFTFVASLSFVSATTCTVAGSIEILLAYLCQVRQISYSNFPPSHKISYFFQITFMGVWPNAIGIFGAILVLVSVVGIALEEKYLSDNASNSDNSQVGTGSEDEVSA